MQEPSRPAAIHLTGHDGYARRGGFVEPTMQGASGPSSNGSLDWRRKDGSTTRCESDPMVTAESASPSPHTAPSPGRERGPAAGPLPYAPAHRPRTRGRSPAASAMSVVAPVAAVPRAEGARRRTLLLTLWWC